MDSYSISKLARFHLVGKADLRPWTDETGPIHVVLTCGSALDKHRRDSLCRAFEQDVP